MQPFGAAGANVLELGEIPGVGQRPVSLPTVGSGHDGICSCGWLRRGHQGALRARGLSMPREGTTGYPTVRAIALEAC